MKSFLEGRPAVSRTASPVDISASRLPSLDRAPADSTVPKMVASSAVVPAVKRERCEKKVETVDIDGVIQKIIVTCGCGEVIEVHCGY